MNAVFVWLLTPAASEQSSRHRDLDAAGRPQGGVPPDPGPHRPLLPGALWETLRAASERLPEGTCSHPLPLLG